MSARAFRHRRFKRIIRLANETIPVDLMLGRAVVLAYWNAGYDPRCIETQLLAWRQEKNDSRRGARLNRNRKSSKWNRTSKRKWANVSPMMKMLIAGPLVAAAIPMALRGMVSVGGWRR